jgi:hypothetical protein
MVFDFYLRVARGKEKPVLIYRTSRLKKVQSQRRPHNAASSTLAHIIAYNYQTLL